MLFEPVFKFLIKISTESLYRTQTTPNNSTTPADPHRLPAQPLSADSHPAPYPSLPAPNSPGSWDAAIAGAGATIAAVDHVMAGEVGHARVGLSLS